jgi:hypothetical protein
MRQIKLKIKTDLKDYSEFRFKSIVFITSGEMHKDIYNMEELEDFYRSLYYRV